MSQDESDSDDVGEIFDKATNRKKAPSFVSKDYKAAWQRKDRSLIWIQKKNTELKERLAEQSEMIKQLQKQLQAAQENANNLNKDKLNDRKAANDLIHQAVKDVEQKQDNALIQAQQAKQEARATINTISISAECDEKSARVAMQMEQDQQAHDAVLRLKDSKFKQYAADIQEMKKNIRKESSSLKATAENAIMKVREETSLEVESMNEQLEATVSRFKSTIAKI
jgi:hypothetical protein